MNRALYFVTTAAVFLCVSIISIVAMPSAFAAEADERAREQFEDVLAGINQNSFEPLKSVIDQKAFSSRVLQLHMLDLKVKNAFDDNFWEIVEPVAMGSSPNATQKSKGRIIKFDFNGAAGQAVVRFRLPNYAFAYQIWNLQLDGRGRLRVLDWFNSNQGVSVTEGVATELLTMMPTTVATQRLIGDKSPTGQQLFQVTELLKAARDRQVPRFFEIYDGLSDPLRHEELIAKFAVQFAYAGEDRDRFIQAFRVFLDVFEKNPDYALGISNSQLLMGQLENGFLSLKKFHESMQFAEGAMPAKLSALALANGDSETAVEYAELATGNEPTLELAWWSLLRAQASALDYSGAIEVLARLEDEFDHQLDAAQLKRDPYKSFDQLSESQEFLDWRAGR